jgi:hypothetical protein
MTIAKASKASPNRIPFASIPGALQCRELAI